MPLSELYRMASGTIDSSPEKNPSCSTEVSFIPESDFAELVWENGQIMVQGQSTLVRRAPIRGSLPSHSPRTREKVFGNDTASTKIGKFGTMDSVLNEIPMSVPSGEIGLNQDDDVVPWLNYSIDGPLQHDYCSEFMPELSGVTVNEQATQNNFSYFDRRSVASQWIRHSHAAPLPDHASLEKASVSKAAMVEGGEDNGPLSGASVLYPSSSQSQQGQISSSYLRSNTSDNFDSMSNATHNVICGDSVRVSTSAGGFASSKMQRPDPTLPTRSTGLMNFSHFLRPVASFKSSIQNIGGRTSSRVSSLERIGSNDKVSASSSSNPSESNLNDFCCSSRREVNPPCQPLIIPSKVNTAPMEPKLPKAIQHEDASKNGEKATQALNESTNKAQTNGEKNIEPVVASSSVCSGNSVEKASDDRAHDLKRKCRDTESEDPSDEVEEESVGGKRSVSARGGTGSKRSRAAEVHNLSERRRRDRINEKMRALQELIPNCNKVDKASMLDEAIEYLKTLQLQVQIMSMGAGLYMPPMMFPPAMPHMHTAHMAHFSTMGIGMGVVTGFGMGMPDLSAGSSGCPMIQVPSSQGAQFPISPMPGATAFHGMTAPNLQLYGLPGQGLSMLMPRAPLYPLSGGPVIKPAMGPDASGTVGPIQNLDATPSSSSKDARQNMNPQPQVMQNIVANSSMNQASMRSDK